MNHNYEMVSCNSIVDSIPNFLSTSSRAIDSLKTAIEKADSAEERMHYVNSLNQTLKGTRIIVLVSVVSIATIIMKIKKNLSRSNRLLLFFINSTVGRT